MGAGATVNLVQGNFIGVGPDGVAHPNGGAGVHVEGPGNTQACAADTR